MKLNELNRILLLIKLNNESWTIHGDCTNLPVLLYDESLQQQGSDHSVGPCRYSGINLPSPCDSKLNALGCSSSFEELKKASNVVKITPQCIAYAAVQVVQSQFLCYCIADDFMQAQVALSDTIKWGQSKNLFKFNDFYHAIVDLF